MSSFIKGFCIAIVSIVISPLLIIYKLTSFVMCEHKIFITYSQFLSLIPEIPGDLIRKIFYFISLKSCNINSTISFGTFFPSQNIVIGKFVYIGANCNVSDSIISDDVMIGSNVNIISGKATHKFADVETPMRLQGGEQMVIHIGKDTWIGNGAIIMADIGDKCIVGAGSVVTKKIDDLSIAVGNPARIIKKRC